MSKVAIFWRASKTRSCTHRKRTKKSTSTHLTFCLLHHHGTSRLTKPPYLTHMEQGNRCLITKLYRLARVTFQRILSALRKCVRTCPTSGSVYGSNMIQVRSGRLSRVISVRNMPTEIHIISSYFVVMPFNDLLFARHFVQVARATLDSYLQKTQNSAKKDIAHSMKSVFKSPVAH